MNAILQPKNPDCFVSCYVHRKCTVVSPLFLEFYKLFYIVGLLCVVKMKLTQRGGYIYKSTALALLRVSFSSQFLLSSCFTWGQISILWNIVIFRNLYLSYTLDKEQIYCHSSNSSGGDDTLLSSNSTIMIILEMYHKSVFTSCQFWTSWTMGNRCLG